MEETNSSRDSFDQIMASTDPAMIIVTVNAKGESAGCLVGFHAQASIEPRRYGVWLSRANRTFEIMKLSDTLGIHFLTRDDFDIAEIFGGMSGDNVDKFALTPTDMQRFKDAEGEIPVLERLPNRVIGRKVSVLDDGGDHVCVVTEPISVSSQGSFIPLRLSEAEQISAGHDADEQ